MVMRQAQALGLVLLIGLTAGCISDGVKRSAARFNPLRGLAAGPVGADVVQLDVALVERPLGDRYLNGELWDLADEQAVSFEKKAALDDNGFRIGLIGGMPPAGLQALLTSERSCANPRRIRLHAGNPTPVVLAPTLQHCRFELHEAAQTTAVKLEQAQCLFQVVPILSEKGKTTLRFTPHINHGETTLAPRPLQEPSGTRRWELQAEQPGETYAKLSWEITLAPNEYVVVGTRLDRDDTLGQRCFLLTDGPTPTQRLLVIRTCRPETDTAPRDATLGKAPPLALQAGWTRARGTSP